MKRSHGLVITLITALVVFCIVQDLVTAAGARRYVQLQEEALAGHARQVTVDQVMAPAIASSIREGLLAAGAVALVGLATVLRSRRS